MNRVCYYQIDFWINEVSSLCILVLMSCCKAFLGERAKLNISPERLMEKKEVKSSPTVTGKEREESGTGTLRLAENFEDSLSESLMPIPRERPLRKPRVKQVLLSVLRESSSFRTLQRRLCKSWDLFSSKRHKRLFIYLFIYLTFNEERHWNWKVLKISFPSEKDNSRKLEFAFCFCCFVCFLIWGLHLFSYITNMQASAKDKIFFLTLPGLTNILKLAEYLLLKCTHWGWKRGGDLIQCYMLRKWQK